MRGDIKLARHLLDGDKALGLHELANLQMALPHSGVGLDVLGCRGRFFFDIFRLRYRHNRSLDG
ncbi:MAG: hypothetical protein P8X55_03210 [Desulfosarcinaceae bacterium]